MNLLELFFLRFCWLWAFFLYFIVTLEPHCGLEMNRKIIYNDLFVVRIETASLWPRNESELFLGRSDLKGVQC